jgi:hypothetical protein
MTREEAVIILDGFKNNPLFSDTHTQALDMAISALSENKAEWLDDVKSEIDKAQEPYITNTAYDEGVRFGLMLAYQIVDRYKAESEEKE